MKDGLKRKISQNLEHNDKSKELSASMAKAFKQINHVMPIRGSNLTASQNYYAYKDKDGIDCRGRPLHDVCHSQSRTSILSVQNNVINLKGFFILFCCMIFALHAQFVVGYLIKFLHMGFSTSFFVMVVNVREKLLHAFAKQSRFRGVFEGLMIMLGGALALFVIQKFSSRRRKIQINPESKSIVHPDSDSHIAHVNMMHYDGLLGGVSWTDALDTMLFGNDEDKTIVDNDMDADYEISIEGCIGVDLGIPQDIGETKVIGQRVNLSENTPSAKIRVAMHAVHVFWPTLVSLIIISVIFVNVHYVLRENYVDWRSRFVVVVMLFSLTMKMLSFSHVCHDVRKAYFEQVDINMLAGTEEECAFLVKAGNLGRSLQLTHFMRYLVLPTLSFQFVYPDTVETDWNRVLRHSILFVCWGLAIKIVVRHFLFPKLLLFFNDDIWRYSISITTIGILLIQYCLTIAFPLVLSWILFFIMCFHDGLTITAELLRFGDRAFYLDWWNASNLAEYWRKWNCPVHNFATRHVYKPLLRRGCHQMVASLIIFVISAAAHEYLTMVVLREDTKGFVMMAFVAQIPLMSLTNMRWFRRNKNFGNVFFWISFCVTGQPLVFLYIYHKVALRTELISPREVDWKETHEGQATMELVDKIVTSGLLTASRLNEIFEGMSEIGFEEIPSLLAKYGMPNIGS